MLGMAAQSGKPIAALIGTRGKLCFPRLPVALTLPMGIPERSDLSSPLTHSLCHRFHCSLRLRFLHLLLASTPSPSR